MTREAIIGTLSWFLTSVIISLAMYGLAVIPLRVVVISGVGSLVLASLYWTDRSRKSKPEPNDHQANPSVPSS